LTYSPRSKRLINQWAADHTTTLADGRPVLALDMYEHGIVTLSGSGGWA
jgi:superoxide dismutase, Fe-Mn family